MYVILDTETTGMEGQDEILEVAIVGSNKQILFHSYVTPLVMKVWPKAQQTHGITPEFIFAGGFPTLEEIKPKILDVVRDQVVVIYNSGFDLKYLPEVEHVAKKVECCQTAFSIEYGEWSDSRNWYKWQSLKTATAYVLYNWEGKPHGAIADCLACGAVWEYLTNPGWRIFIDVKKKAIFRENQLQFEVDSYLHKIRLLEVFRFDKAHDISTKQLWDRLKLRPESAEYKALESAEALCLHDTGYTLHDWLKYGERLLNLPRVKQIPEGFRTLDRIHEWHPVEARQHSRYMLEKRKYKGNLNLVPLYDFRGLKAGRDYVEKVTEWPENAYSASYLKKTLKVKPEVIATLPMVAIKYTTRSYYYLYEYMAPAKEHPQLTLELKN